jgi:hypothetical protein
MDIKGVQRRWMGLERMGALWVTGRAESFLGEVRKKRLPGLKSQQKPSNPSHHSG